MKVERLTGGKLANNAYFLVNEITRNCILIDTFEQTEPILNYLENNCLKLEAILLTHGHFDHISGVKKIKDKTNCRVYLHKDDVWKITAFDQMARMCNIQVEPFDVDYEIQGDEENLEIIGYKIKAIHTPGHTKGGVCYMIDEMIFVGDTIFKDSYGRTDFEDSDFQTLKSSILKIFNLEGDYLYLPGHGDVSTSKYEKLYNPISRD